jgi:hypothetical protein
MQDSETDDELGGWWSVDGWNLLFRPSPCVLQPESETIRLGAARAKPSRSTCGRRARIPSCDRGTSDRRRACPRRSVFGRTKGAFPSDHALYMGALASAAGSLPVKAQRVLQLAVYQNGTNPAHDPSCRIALGIRDVPERCLQRASCDRLPDVSIRAQQAKQ